MISQPGRGDCHRRCKKQFCTGGDTVSAGMKAAFLSPRRRIYDSAVKISEILRRDVITTPEKGSESRHVYSCNSTGPCVG